MAFDPIPVGTRLSSGATIGARVGVNTYAIDYGAPARPSAGAYPQAVPVNGGGNGGPVVIQGGGGCGGNGVVYPQSIAAMQRGAAKRPDFGPVVVFTSQTLPKGFRAGVNAFGLVVPEGR